MTNVTSNEGNAEDKVINIKINDNHIDINGPRTTGLKIKQAAISQGVDIELDFSLSVLRGPSQSDVVGDSDPVTVNKNSEFIATAHDDNSDTAILINDSVNEAIEEIKAVFPDCIIKSNSDGAGGAYVTIELLDCGNQYVNNMSWIGFHVTFQYPYADVYPHFVRSDLKRKNGVALGEGFSDSKFDGKAAIQVSRRSNKLDPNRDTAVSKLIKVIHWLRVQ